MTIKYQIKEKTFENGATLFYIESPSDDISVIANINAGSLYETDENAGISHLVEHMIFKGTSKRGSRDVIYNEFGLLGGQWYCHTTQGNIPLGMRVVREDFESALELLSDVLYDARMEEQEIEKEKKIVLSEIRDRADDPYSCLWDSYTQNQFAGCDLARPIIGFAEVVESFDPCEVAQFYKEMFTPANTNIFVVGSLPYKEVEEMVQKYFGMESNGPSHEVSKVVLPPNEAKEIVIPKELDNVHLMMGRLVPAWGGEDSYPLTVLGSSLSRSVSERILNQEPISYNRWVYYDSNRCAGSLVAYATCDAKDYNRVRELIGEEFSKYSEGKIPEDFILDAIEKRKKSYVLQNSTTMAKAKTALEFWLLGDMQRINTHLDFLDQLTIEQVKDVGRKHVRLDDLVCVSLGDLGKNNLGG